MTAGINLTLHTSPDMLLVRSMGENTITVAQTTYDNSLILLPDAIHSDWEIAASDQLTRAHAGQLLEHQPELVILGTGPNLVFPRQVFNFALLSQGVGCEVMDTRAACRTDNGLASEGRRVLGAFMLPAPS